MASKKINELSVKVPVFSDQLAVADSTTGIAGKASCQDVVSAGLNGQGGIIPVQGSFALGRTSVSLTANTNNLAIGNQPLVRVSSTGNYDLTGIVPIGGEDANVGRLIYIVNTGSNNVIFKHQDVLSTDINRFITQTGSSVTLTPGQIVIAIYDLASRWRVWNIS